VILYLDTSSLVKLYVPESGSEMIKTLVAEATSVVTSRIACPEFYSAVTRRLNSKEITRKNYEILCAAFSADWQRMYALDFDEVEAGKLVCRHGLRGADAIHLASALQLVHGGDSLEIVFSSADRKLNEAAEKEGFAREGRVNI
jgi:predicted nucleic acid-binding protein